MTEALQLTDEEADRVVYAIVSAPPYEHDEDHIHKVFDKVEELKVDVALFEAVVAGRLAVSIGDGDELVFFPMPTREDVQRVLDNAAGGTHGCP